MSGANRAPASIHEGLGDDWHGRARWLLQNGSAVFSLSHARCGYILLSTILPAAEQVSQAARGRRVGRALFLIRSPGSLMPAEVNPPTYRQHHAPCNRCRHPLEEE